ncbi:hypothetical protein OC835_002448 [Tilletia horrida]|nr:hypothetical protein OC835_002448 [Tilletia horrida]
MLQKGAAAVGPTGVAPEVNEGRRGPSFTGAITRLVLPLLNAVRRPYHLYPIGVLFGLGFDTASTITLLSVAAIAQHSADASDGSTTNNSGRVIMLALLFTAGMTLVDSCDSVIMMFAYSRLGREEQEGTLDSAGDEKEKEEKPAPAQAEQLLPDAVAKDAILEVPAQDAAAAPNATSQPKIEQISHEVAPAISFYLTLLSVILAFAICIIEVFGIAAEQCASCADAAAVEPSSERSLNGRWWAFWAAASDHLGYIGAGIVGLFVVVTAAWWISRCAYRWRTRNSDKGRAQTSSVLPQLRSSLRGGFQWRKCGSRHGFTLAAQSIFLVGGELLANTAIWAITAVVFVVSHRRSDLALAVLAWTTGLRHGLDADHISAIDNSIRRFLALERENALSAAALSDFPIVELESQTRPSSPDTGTSRTRWQWFLSGFHAPILTGLFFSLGHSTIVLIATVIVAITTSALSGLQAFGDGAGGYVGTIVSASFLFLVGLLNSVLLWRAWSARKRATR